MATAYALRKKSALDNKKMVTILYNQRGTIQGYRGVDCVQPHGRDKTVEIQGVTYDLVFLNLRPCGVWKAHEIILKFKKDLKEKTK